MPRPTKYTDQDLPDLIKKFEQYGKKGYTNKDIAHALGIEERTFYKLKKNHDVLNAALAAGRQTIITEIKGILLKRARGMTETITSEKHERNPESGELELVERKTQQIFIPPDITACMAILNNYDPHWTNDRDRKRAVDINETKEAKKLP